MAERDIASPDEAYLVAQWLNDNKAQKGSDRYQKVRSKLVSYIDNNPDYQHPDGPPNPPTAFGAKVLAGGSDANLPTQPPPGFSGPLQGMLSGPKAPPPPPPTPAEANEAARFGRDTLPVLPGQPGAPEDTPKEAPDNSFNLFNRNIREDIADKGGAMASTALKGALAATDVAGSMAINAAKASKAGWAGITDLALGHDYNDAANVVNFNQSTPSKPFSEGGKDLVQGLATPMKAVDDHVKDAAWFLAGENPELATLAYTAVNMWPSEMGGLAAAPARSAANTLMRNTDRFYNQMGITLGSRKMRESMDAAANNSISDIPAVRGAALEPMAQAIQKRAKDQQDATKAAQDTVEASSGRISVAGVQKTADTIDSELRQKFDESMYAPNAKKNAQKEAWNAANPTKPPKPLVESNVEIARRKLQEIVDIASAQSKSTSPGNYVDMWRLKQLRSHIETLPGADSGPLAVIRDGVRDFINTQIAKGFVRGDKNLTGNLAYLKQMREQYAREFVPETEVYRMATDLKASPEDFSKYIFGLGENGFKTEAAQVAEHVASIFGHASPEMDALRLEFLNRLVAPLRKQVKRADGTMGPDWKGFTDLYDKVGAHNSTLLDNLGNPQLSHSLEGLYRLSKVHDKVGDQFKFNWDGIQRRIIAEAAGNGLARNATKLQFLNNMRKWLLGRGQAATRKAQLQEMFPEVKLDQPLFAPGSLQTQMAWSSALATESKRSKDKK